MLERIREEMVTLHLELPRNNLVAWTSGNISWRDVESGFVVIKPSGIRYEELRAEHMVIVDLEGDVVEGSLKPSSDTASHLYIYRHRPDVNGIVHTHSRYATAFAAVGRPIPVYLTAQGDEFGGPFASCSRWRAGQRRRTPREPGPAESDRVRQDRHDHERPAGSDGCGGGG